MSLFVDTSVWSLALRRDTPGDAPEQVRLREALASQKEIWTTGLVLQELLQGFRGPTARDAIADLAPALNRKNQAAAGTFPAFNTSGKRRWRGRHADLYCGGLGATRGFTTDS